MRSSIMSLRTAQVLCLAMGLASAQTEGFCVMTKPAKDEVVPSGSDYNIVWESGSSSSGSVFITLLEGSSPSTLQLGANITSGLDSSAGGYTWSVDSSLGDDATYGLKVTLESDPTIFQYSNPFQIGSATSGSGSGSETQAAGAAGHTMASRAPESVHKNPGSPMIA